MSGPCQSSEPFHMDIFINLGPKNYFNEVTLCEKSVYPFTYLRKECLSFIIRIYLLP